MSQLDQTGEGQPHIQRTIADQVVAELHREILRGHHPAGSWLRITDTAKRFGTSSMPVREALRKLDALGLVHVVPHRGAQVAELTAEDLADSYSARRAIEGSLIEQSAARFDEQDRREAQEALDRHESLLRIGDVEAARDAHTAFHFRLYRSSGARWLLRSLEPVWQNCERYRFATPSDQAARESSAREHAAILAACAANDSDRAGDAMRAHLDGALARILRSMQELEQ